MYDESLVKLQSLQPLHFHFPLLLLKILLLLCREEKTVEICVDELCISITDDHSRITLKAENNHGNSDYINASPIVSIVYSLWLCVVANICCL